MTPKEKANELFDIYLNDADMSRFEAVRCALIAVDEILSINKLQDVESQKYWEEVKQEIENL